MIIDSTLEFCDGTTISGAGSAIDEAKGTVIDLGANTDNATKDWGAGEPLYLVLNVTTAFAAGTSVTIDLRSDTATSLESADKIHWTTGIVLLADYATLTGMQSFALPSTVSNYERYLGIHVKTVGSVTGGVCDAFLTKDVANWTSTDSRTD